MTTRTLCEATAMDVARFGSWDDAVPPPCDELAEVDVDGYLLCRGCAQALADLGTLGRAGLKARMARAARDADLRWEDVRFVLAVVVVPSVVLVGLSLAVGAIAGLLGVR